MKRILLITLCFIGGIINFATSQVNLTKSLVAFYPFNGNANDASGNGANATVNNATLTTDRFGIPNSAYYCNGASKGMSVTSVATSGAPGITLSVWINTTTTASGAQILQGNPGLIIMGYFNKGHFLSAFDGTSGNNSPSDESTSTYNAGNWVNLTCYNNGTQTKNYINGVLDKTYSETLFNTTGPFNMAQYSSGLGTGYTGKFDEVRVYARALSDSEIMALYEMPVAFFSNKASFCFGDTLKCTDSSFSNVKLTYSWNFGDNATSLLKNPIHVYSKAGTYKVFLKISTPYGATDTISKYVKILDKPIPFCLWYQSRFHCLWFSKVWYKIRAMYICVTGSRNLKWSHPQNPINRL